MSATASTPRPIVICGPSGSGKGTIINKLFKEYPSTFALSISHTTRQPRPGEQDGREYHFTDLESFQKLVQENGFIEHAQFGSNCYGTSVKAVQEISSSGLIPVLEIEMEGVKQVQQHPQFKGVARYLFLEPPSMEVLRERLTGRGTDKPEAIERRLAQAENEMAFSREEGRFDKIVKNDDLERAYGEVKAWVFEKA